MLGERANLLHQVNGYKLELQIALNKYKLKMNSRVNISLLFYSIGWQTTSKWNAKLIVCY